MEGWAGSVDWPILDSLRTKCSLLLPSLLHHVARSFVAHRYLWGPQDFRSICAQSSALFLARPSHTQQSAHSLTHERLISITMTAEQHVICSRLNSFLHHQPTDKWRPSYLLSVGDDHTVDRRRCRPLLFWIGGDNTYLSYPVSVCGYPRNVFFQIYIAFRKMWIVNAYCVQ